MATSDHRQRVETLFRRYAGGVGSYVLARVGDAAAAETITSDVFLIVVRQIEQCKTSPVAWLWSIVRTEIARYYRQRRPTAALSETLPDLAPTPDVSAEKQEMAERMHAALPALSDEQQQIIYLKYFMDLSNVEIARELGLGVSNVGVIAHRAVRRLRELMEEHHHHASND